MVPKSASQKEASSSTSSVRGSGINLLSHFYTKCVPHAALRNFHAQCGSEVTVMASQDLTTLEREIALIEQTLHAMIQINPTAAQVLVENSQQRTTVPPR